MASTIKDQELRDAQLELVAELGELQRRFVEAWMSGDEEVATLWIGRWAARAAQSLKVRRVIR